MNTRTILILAVVTALIVAAAAFSLRSRESLTAAEDSELAGQPLFPQLAERVNDVAAVTVVSADGTFRLERSGETWGAADKGGYPVDFERVKGLVVSVSALDVIEPKTSNPAMFSKLGVEDPGTGEESTSKRVTVEDASGTVLADVVIGEARQARGRGMGEPSLYVRPAGDDQSYEATGRVNIDTNLSNWLDKQIVRLEKERVQRVVIRHPDGEELTVFMENKDDANFQVAGLPEGRELMWDGVANSVGGALAFLNLEDVGGEDLVDFDAHEKTVAEFTTWDGLIVTATLVEVDEVVYLRVDALFDEASRYEVATVPPPPTPEEGAEGAEAEVAEVAEVLETGDEAGKTPEEVTEEASEIVERSRPWTYVVPGYTAANLRKRVDELLAELEQDPAIEEPPAEAEESERPVEVVDPVEDPPPEEG